MDYLNRSGLSQQVIKENIDKNILEELLSTLVSTVLLDFEIEDLNLVISEATIANKPRKRKLLLLKYVPLKIVVNVLDQEVYVNLMEGENVANLKVVQKARKEEAFVFDMVVVNVVNYKGVLKRHNLMVCVKDMGVVLGAHILDVQGVVKVVDFVEHTVVAKDVKQKVAQKVRKEVDIALDMVVVDIVSTHFV
jgi:hypothetical protein